MSDRALAWILCLSFSVVSLAAPAVAASPVETVIVADVDAAADASPLADADLERLLTASRVQRLVEKTRELFATMMKQAMSQMADDAKRQQVMQVQKRVDQVLSWDAVRPALMDYYREMYAERDVLQLIDFYQSPRGAIYVDMLPRLMRYGVGGEMWADPDDDEVKRDMRNLEEITEFVQTEEGRRIGQLLEMESGVPLLLVSRIATVTNDIEEVPQSGKAATAPMK
ncbi:MAG: DUF2059 domain-containing protein [Xanthomonadaceae bacterium]|jgi:hypothetical protein|nr:DUF2059 domain-containing protein [Xanthomonadaceae bacterium]